MINRRKAKLLMSVAAIGAIGWWAYPTLQSLQPLRERAIDAYGEQQQLMCFKTHGLTLQDVIDRNRKECVAKLAQARAAVAGLDCDNWFNAPTACIDYRFFDMAQCQRAMTECPEQSTAALPLPFTSNLAYLLTVDGVLQMRGFATVLVAALLLIARGDRFWKAFKGWITR